MNRPFPPRLAAPASGLHCGPTTVNAAPLLTTVAANLEAVRLEAILIGNAAAALHGAPVTTLDFDFMFRATPPR